MFGPNWYALNATRRYPLADAATGRGDDGVELPPGVLVDLVLRFPGASDERAYLAAARVTDHLVSFVFAATSDDGPGRPVAALSVPRPIDAFRHLPLDGLIPGAGGTAVLGPNLDPCEFRASAPAQSLLLAHCATAYRPAGVLGLGRDGEAPLTGTVAVIGAGDLIATIRNVPVLIDDAEVTVAALVLDLADPPGHDVPASYVGPCGGRPQEGTCSTPAILRVGGVTPNCDGEVWLRVKCLDVAPFVGGLGGAALDLGVGLGEICAWGRSDLGAVEEDACESVSWASYSSSSDGLVLPPPPVPPVPVPPPQPTGTCAGLLPRIHDFSTWTVGWPQPPTGLSGKGFFEILAASGSDPKRLALNDTTRLQWFGDFGVKTSTCTELNAGYKVQARIRTMPGADEVAAGLFAGMSYDIQAGVYTSLFLLLNPRQRALELYVQDGGGLTLLRAASTYGYYPQVGAWYDLTLTVTSTYSPSDVPGLRPLLFSAQGTAVPVDPGQATVTVSESNLSYVKFWDGAWGVAALRSNAEARSVRLEAL